MDVWVLIRHTRQEGRSEVTGVNGVFTNIDLAKTALSPQFEWTSLSEDGSFTGTNSINIARDLDVSYTLELHTVDENVN